jgi:hypothetical protein
LLPDLIENPVNHYAMAVKIIFLCTILAYSVIVSQSFMYIVALRQVQLNLKASTYTEFRKLIDASMRSNFKYAVYGALITNLLLVIATVNDPAGLKFIAACVAFVCLITDTILTFKGNIPVNKAINEWSVDNYPVNWADFRSKWLNIFQYRQVATISGFVSLLIGVVFG